MNLRSALLPLCLLAALPSLAAARGLDVRDLQKLDRVSSPVLSPDGSTVVFAKRIVDADVVKASSSLWVRNLLTRDMAPPKRLTPEGWNVNSPSFSPDGKTVYFLSAKSGTQQLYAMPLVGGAPRQLTAFALDVASYKVSPDGTRVLFSTDTFADCKADFACTKKRLDDTAAKKSSGVVYDGLFVRHWDTWADGRRSRLFVAALPEGKAKPVSSATSLTDRLDGDAPSKPFGGADEYTWSPDGASVVAAIRVAGKGEAWSTNFDLYQVAADGSSAPVNLTAANPAWDTGPAFSADGKTLFYRAMKRPGFEADRFGLMAMDLATKQVRELAPSWDRSADGIVVSKDGATIYTTAQDVGQHPLFAVDVASGAAKPVVAEGSISAFDIAGDTLAFTRNTLKTGDQLFTTTLAGAPLRAITPSAQDVLKDVNFGDFEQFNFTG